MDALITIKIATLSQIVITPSRINVTVVEKDYRDYYEDIREHVLVIQKNLEDLHNLTGDYRIVGTKIKSSTLVLTYVFTHNGKSLGKVFIPLDMGYGSITNENRNNNIQSNIFTYTYKGTKRVAIPTQHAINQFILRYNYVIGHNIIVGDKGAIPSMREMFNRSVEYNNWHTYMREKKRSKDCVYLRYETKMSDIYADTFGFVVDPITDEIITFELHGKHRDMNKMINEWRLTLPE